MSTFLAVRHTRAEEESGRAELIAATPASRAVPTTATLVHGVIANTVLAVFVALGLIAGGLEAAGSVVAGVATGAVGVAFLGVGMLVAQFMRTSRGANGVSAALVGIAFLLRGLGDALGTPSADGLSMTSSWLSWLSPIGWGQHVFAYTANDLAPLLLCVALAAACLVTVFLLQAQRDNGASLLAGTRGRSHAPAYLSGAFALGWRLQWPSILGWCVAAAVFGVFAGSLSPLIAQATDTDPAIGDALASVTNGGGTMDQVLFSAMFSMIGILAATCAIQVTMRARQEETSGMAEAVLATPVARARWLSGYLVLGAISAVIVLISGAVVSALAVLGTGADPDGIGRSFAAAAAQLPAALIYLALGGILVVFLPPLAIGLGWTALAVGAVLGAFGGLIGLPEWARDISPFAHTPSGDMTDWAGWFWMLAIALVVASIAVTGSPHRELRTA